MWRNYNSFHCAGCSQNNELEQKLPRKLLLLSMIIYGCFDYYMANETGNLLM